MPQEAWILKCYLCKKFQVQLKKKAKKWKCTVCGSKQDIMTIFFKGTTSDCRINVQNMSAAEGEKLEKLQQESYYQDENILDECDNESQDLDFDDLMYDQTDEFTEENLEEIDQQCFEAEEINFEDIEEVDQELSIIKSNSQDNKKSFDLDTSSNTDHRVENNKTSNNKFSDCSMTITTSNNQNQHSNIFESNYDIDESLDF